MLVRMMISLTVMLCLAGCLPSTLVKKNPGPDDTGVRYYRPKPYLFVTPQMKSGGTPVDGMVKLSIEMLPDYSEEYSIHIKTGLGSNNTRIKLADGWNLTEINIDADSNFNENLDAIKDFASKAITLSGAGGKSTDLSLNVHATNVPLGLYESVIAVGPDCKKHLYGFRYIGFLPFSPCPTTMSGGQSVGCEFDEIYGMFYEKGAMVFRRLSEGPTLKNTEEHIEKTDEEEEEEEVEIKLGRELKVEDGFET